MKVKNKNNCYNDKCNDSNMVDIRKNYGFKYKNLNSYQEKLTDLNNKDERCCLKSFNPQKITPRNTYKKRVL